MRGEYGDPGEIHFWEYSFLLSWKRNTMFSRTVPTAIHIIIFWSWVLSQINVKHFYYWFFLEFPFYKVHVHLLKFAKLNRYERAVMKRKKNYCYKAGIACNKTELIQWITSKLDNLIMKGMSHERQTNTCLTFPFHTYICAIINLSNKGQRKWTNQELTIY